MVIDSYEVRDDGSVSFMLNCPHPDCDKDFRVTWQRYKSPYKAKRKTGDRVGQFRWRFSTLSAHMLDAHSRTPAAQTDDASSTSATDEEDSRPENG